MESRKCVSIAAVHQTKLNERSALLSCAGLNIIPTDQEGDNI